MLNLEKSCVYIEKRSLLSACQGYQGESYFFSHFNFHWKIFHHREDFVLKRYLQDSSIFPVGKEVMLGSAGLVILIRWGPGSLHQLNWWKEKDLWAFLCLLSDSAILGTLMLKKGSKRVCFCEELSPSTSLVQPYPQRLSATLQRGGKAGGKGNSH